MPQYDQFGEPVAQGAGYRWAELISRIFHPTVNGIASFLAVGAFANTGRGWLFGLAWAMLCILVLITPTTLYFRNRVQRGNYSDHDVSHRGERNGLYAVAMGSILFGSVVLMLMGVPTVFLRLIVAGVAIVGLCGVINLNWKVSVHAASVGALATLLSILLRGFGIGFWVVVALVGWARVRTGNHTVLQVVAGWVVAIVGVVLAFQLRS